jgi:hypothetical protein
LNQRLVYYLEESTKLLPYIVTRTWNWRNVWVFSYIVTIGSLIFSWLLSNVCLIWLPQKLTVNWYCLLSVEIKTRVCKAVVRIPTRRNLQNFDHFAWTGSNEIYSYVKKRRAGWFVRWEISQTSNDSVQLSREIDLSST